jgi:multicomponent Na+:H+ antiporter subunit E
VLGYVVLAGLSRGGVLPARLTARLGNFLRLAAFLVYELVLANIRMTLDVVRPGTTMRPGVIRVPLDVTTDGEILMLSALINLTPGSIALDVSDDRRTLYVHVMHIKSPEESRREIKDGFERRVLELFR